MKAQQLKNAILQLAIQGKLVPQDPNDEPASVLLEKIKAEKERLIAEGKIKKGKKTADKSPYMNQQDYPFEIPDSWVWVRLEDILRQLTDGTHSTPKYTEKGIPFLSVKNISSGTLSFHNTKYISISEHLELIKRCKPEKNDILLSKVGTTGIPVLVNFDIDFSIFVSIALLKLFDDYVLPEFLIYAIQSPLVQTQAKENTRGVGNKNWVLTSIGDTVISLPPLNEQKRIVAKLEELLPFIDQYDKTEQKLTALRQQFPEQLKKSILQAAIQGKLTEQNPHDESASELIKRIQAEKERLILTKKIKKPKQQSEIFVRDNCHYERVNGVERCIQDEIPFDIPESWAWVRLDNLGEIIGGGTPKTEITENWINGNIAWITPADMKYINGKYIEKGSRNITEKGLLSSSARMLSRNSIIYSSRAPIGYIAITQNELCTNQGFKSIDLYNKELVDYLYFCLVALTPSIQARASGTTFKEISGSEFGKTIVPIPPLNEQKQVIDKIEKLILFIDQM